MHEHSSDFLFDQWRIQNSEMVGDGEKIGSEGRVFPFPVGVGLLARNF